MTMRKSIFAILLLLLAAPAGAQDKGTLNPTPLPPLAHPEDPATPAKEVFGRKREPIPLEARSIGFYAKGCLAGAVALPVNGKTWQVMRLSRNRNWGHPAMVRFLENLAEKAPKVGWRGLLVGATDGDHKEDVGRGGVRHGRATEGDAVRYPSA